MKGVTPLKGQLEHYLINGDFRAEVSSSNVRGSKRARLSYQRLKEERGDSLLEVTLETGRYHQIRLQLSTMGFPIVGDHKYGSDHKLGEGIALHHYRLEVPHPITGKITSFQAPLWRENFANWSRYDWNKQDINNHGTSNMKEPKKGGSE